MSDEKEKLNQTKKEVNWWLYGAGTIPFVALAALFFFEFIGLETIYNKLLLIGAMTFFSVAVFWWFWAMFKIKFLADVVSKSVEGFKEIKDIIRDVRDNLKD